MSVVFSGAELWSWTLATPEQSLDEMHNQLQEQGFLVIEGLAPDLAAEAYSELDPHIDAAPFGHDEFLGSRTKRLGGVLMKLPNMKE